MTSQFQLILSSTQAQYIQDQLPSGYSLQLSDQHQSRELKRAPSFKHSLEAHSPRPKRPHLPPTRQLLPPPGDLLIIPFPKHPAKSLQISLPSKPTNPTPPAQPPLLLTKQRSKKINYQQQQLMTQKQFSQCQKILHQLRRHNCIGPFLYPIDPVKQGLFNYYDIVKQPMDLTTIDRKLKRDEYNTQQAFINDLNRMINNSLNYNQPGSEIYSITVELKEYLEQICISILDRPIYNTTTGKSKNESIKINLLKKKIAKLQGQIKKFGTGPILPQFQTKKGRHRKHIPPVALPMSMAEKKKLGQNIRRLPAQYLQGLWRLVRTGIKNIDNGTEEIEIDIDQLSIPKTRELERYVNTKIKVLNRIQQKEKKLQKSREMLQIGRIEDQMIIGNQDFMQLQFPQDQQQQQLSQQEQQQQQLLLLQSDQMLVESIPDFHQNNMYNLISQDSQPKYGFSQDQIFEKSEKDFHYEHLRKSSNISMNSDSGFQNH